MSQPGLDELTPVNLRSTPALIADRLREQIVSGAFASGSRMIEPRLGARLGISRGPVREALQRLVQEGLLVNIPNRGVFVVEHQQLLALLQGKDGQALLHAVNTHPGLGGACLVRAGDPARAPLGEAAVVLVAEDAAVVRGAGRPMDAEILSAEFGQ
ncbi:GntR family transcriptional regulator [Streptomyces sp. L-9-10]|uniref:GntR family transcriptional regulator n=1 Tax=Streptomyces sp. L-9-10 TaxID=1478131 RepID=UPI001F02863A|nr:GntR family transcriptional regulator [Streptomyces sp. L-9-10]